LTRRSLHALRFSYSYNQILVIDACAIIYHSQQHLKYRLHNIFSWNQNLSRKKGIDFELDWWSMIKKATYNDKDEVVNILSASFDDNKSVNYLIKQDGNRKERIRRLMAYSFEVCYCFGEVYLSSDNSGCALLLFPDKKKTSLKTILLDIKLIIACIGISNLAKAVNRESKVKRFHPKSPIYYLWFIGVLPAAQNKGIGSRLLHEVIELAAEKRRPIYLETSTLRNIPWYEKLGFATYEKLHFGYELFCMKKEV